MSMIVGKQVDIIPHTGVVVFGEHAGRHLALSGGQAMPSVGMR